MRQRGAVATLLVAGMAIGAMVGCEPAPPQAQIEVTTTAEGSDVEPGDGACEVSSGVGDCTLRAAIEEGNASGHADIAVPPGSYPMTESPIVVTGDLRIAPATPGKIDLYAALEVAEQGVLSASDLRGWDLTFVVAGSLVLSHSQALTYTTPLTVTATGRAVVDDSFLTGGRDAVVNDGVVALLWSTVYSYATTLVTNPGGRTELTASAVVNASRNDQPEEPSCTGEPPVSHGYNLSENDGCELAGPGDANDVGELARISPSPLVDAVPEGVLGCGGRVVRDEAGDPRPVDGDGDSVSACDIGYQELQP